MKLLLFLFLMSVGLVLAGCSIDLRGKAVEFQSASEQQQSPQPADECASNDDCPAGKFCVDSVCGTFQNAGNNIENNAAKVSCIQNSDCTDGACIDGECGKLEYLHVQKACSATCNVKRVVVKTSDGETYDFVPGKGSYTAAGALEWRIVRGPNHCAGDEIKVPVQITRRQYGKVLSEEYITLAEKVPSKTLKHPSVNTLAFILTADVIEEQCS